MADVVTRTCSRCGTMADAPEDGLPEGWSFEVDKLGGVRYQCPSCVRSNIRAIEGKLSEEYWEW